MAMLRCPTCGKLFEADESSPAMPFCSRRCKLIDLGRWLDEAQGIPVDEFDEEDFEE